MSKAVPFQTIQFSINTQFKYKKQKNSRNYGLVLSNPWIGPLSFATTPDQSGPGSDGNEGVLQHYWNLTIRLFCVVSRILDGGSYSSAEVQSVYSTPPADWATERKRNKST